MIGQIRALQRFAAANIGRFGLASRMRILESNETEARHVVAFSLYGHDPRYVSGGIANIEAYGRWFPEFVCRFYVASDVDAAIVRSLRDAGAEVFVMSGTGYDPSHRFWRFLAADDVQKDRFLIRDIDSAASKRERCMYEEWVASGRTWNVIRDHYSHSMRIMAGMWGGRTRPRFMAAALSRVWLYRNHYSRDQNFLSRELYPRIRRDVLVQDIIRRFPDEEVALQAVDEVDFSFVGEIATDARERTAWRAHFRTMHHARQGRASAT